MRFILPILMMALSGACSDPGAFNKSAAEAARLNDADNDGYSPAEGDCNDAPGVGAAINPRADEVCDGVDNDCDTQIDSDDLDVKGADFYFDGDGDGSPQEYAHLRSCPDAEGNLQISSDSDLAEIIDAADGVADGTELDSDVSAAIGLWQQPGYDEFGNPIFDCDDENGATFPGADEYCDSVDNDCDTQIDEEPTLDGMTWFADADGDGFGDADFPATQCNPPEGFVADATDCDDGDEFVSPAADEVCDDIDNDCDGSVDSEDSSVIEEGMWYEDLDRDLYGSDVYVLACTMPEGHSATGGDCDDDNSARHPAADEVCNDIDDDCDALTDSRDPDAVDEPAWYRDVDADMYGNETARPYAVQCTMPPGGYVSNNGDCADGNASVNPGTAEVLGNPVDENCDGLVEGWCDPADHVEQWEITHTLDDARPAPAEILVYGGINQGPDSDWTMMPPDGVTIEEVSDTTVRARVTGCFAAGTELALEFRYVYAVDAGGDTGDTGAPVEEWMEESFCDPLGGVEEEGAIEGSIEAFADSVSLWNSIGGGGTDRCWAVFTAPGITP